MIFHLLYPWLVVGAVKLAERLFQKKPATPIDETKRNSPIIVDEDNPLAARHQLKPILRLKF